MSEGANDHCWCMLRGSAAIEPESEAKGTYTCRDRLTPTPARGMTATANGKALGLTIPDKLIALADGLTRVTEG